MAGRKIQSITKVIPSTSSSSKRPTKFGQGTPLQVVDQVVSLGFLCCYCWTVDEAVEDGDMVIVGCFFFLLVFFM
jgi:hypothetical protein